ncbi:d58e994d-3e3d-436e-83f2-cd6eb0e099dd [Thermothielavioides terrestris]|uniref:D58e994d-3e3d-436e-83f2-cd6eb0e099dd n=1 Tax=Thermothielavioides terrestris TaxID=2587410 RepID=A0A3S4D5K7_9PEZI|nr:d58e994d-3e3d-436e-83f2-cd6eb0e099dd [Thermothielavioides terrestris]
MPLSLVAPVLQVDANVIHQVDTTNPANLFSMWTVFARCRDSVAQGRRLENLSWRLWNRETFCCEGQEMLVSECRTSKARDIQYTHVTARDDIPQLSGSVDSVADEEAVDINTGSSPVDIARPRIQRQDSCASSRSRGRERHITSDELEKMVVSIMETKEPLNAPLPVIPRSPVAETPACGVESERTGSTTTESPCETSENPSPDSVASQQLPAPADQSGPIVTRGFSPPQVPLSRITSQASKAPSPSAIPEPTDAPAPKVVLPKKQQAMFALGGSSGSEEESFNSRKLEARKQVAAPSRAKMFQIGGSSGEEESPQNAQQLQRPVPKPDGQKKTASFNNQVVTQTFTSSAISDTEDDYLDESAIDDDDEDWEEESTVESGDSSVEEKINFKRVDSTAHLPSRRSMITLMLAANNNRAQRLGNVASQSTSAIPRARPSLNGPSVAVSPNDSDESPLMMRGTSRAPPMRPINEVPRSAAQPINVTATGMHYQAALSPRTTRRNMLATELTESLRRNLLRERSHKTSTANAVLKRRHTTHDVANLKQYPERPFMKKEKEIDTNPNSWDQYFQNPFTGQAQAW